MASNSISTSQNLQTAKVLNATDGKERTSVGSFVTLAGRILFSAIFIMSGFLHFSQSDIGYAAQAGVPTAKLLVPASGILAQAGVAQHLCSDTWPKSAPGCWSSLLTPVPPRDDAQLLGGEKSDDGSDANGNVSEERDHAWRRVAHLSIRSRWVESGCSEKLEGRHSALSIHHLAMMRLRALSKISKV